MLYLMVMLSLLFVLIEIGISLLAAIEEAFIMIMLMLQMGRNAGKLARGV
jgi:hypothetical protein